MAISCIPGADVGGILGGGGRVVWRVEIRRRLLDWNSEGEMSNVRSMRYSGHGK